MLTCGLWPALMHSQEVKFRVRENGGSVGGCCCTCRMEADPEISCPMWFCRLQSPIVQADNGFSTREWR